MAKYKLTGFARFIIFLIIATPIVYLIASYYNGEDGIANIKSLFTGDKSAQEVQKKEGSTSNNTTTLPTDQEMDLETALQRIESLQKELEDCRKNRN